MKFSKKYSFQMVQEWKEAYMDYKHLKKQLKAILKFQNQNALSFKARKGGFLQRKITLNRSFSGLKGQEKWMRKIEDDVIVVSPVQQESGEYKYETMFMKSMEVGAENEICFFNKLDGEFNKVLSFYRGKVKEVKMQAAELSKQMDTLIALRIAVEKPVTAQIGTEGDGSSTEFGFVNGRQEGIFTGGSVALIAGTVVTIHARRLLQHEGREQYMDNIFPLYSFLGFIFLHMFLYGINTYLWRLFRVNYPFIFGFKPGTELGFREIFLLASGLLVLTLAAVLSNLDMDMDPRTKSYQTLTELVPAVLVTVLLLLTFCPLNILYRSSRFCLIRCAWRCLCAPFYKVTFSDFFLADQLTSQVQAFRSFQFYICYYGWGDFKKRSNKCLESNTYQIIYILVAVIPFWSRCLQCLRRLFEEKDIMQGFNSLKYFSTVTALVIRTIYDFKRGMFWKIMAGTSSGITTIFSTYWDIVIDWGLLQKKTRNPLLRDKLLIPNKAVYFMAIVVNILLRLVWMQLVLDFHEAPFLHRRVMIALVACLEIVRRGIWNFFRLENEHFNNIENYRAFKPFPLPFHYEEQENFL